MLAVLFDKINTHVALVTLNRPEAYNAINDEVALLLDKYVKQTEADPDIRVVLLTGAGEKAFCAGADLKMIASGRGKELGTVDNGFAGFVYAKRTKPWIAMVDGFALAGGTELCLACDMICASENSKFGLPEVTRGLVAGAGGMFRLPKMISEKVAIELLCTGGQLSAKRAYDLGLINRLVASTELRSVTEELANAIAANSPNSIRKTLAFAKASLSKSESECISESNALFEEILLSEDAMEGTKAFVEKRPPVWKS